MVNKRVKRIAVLDRDLCSPKACGFYLCQKVCPINRSGEDCITVLDADKKPLIDENLCIACQICTKKCPKNAIVIVNLPEQLKETPIHRYGKNMFTLYRLPVPKLNAVVGLVGPNGVGKSTVMNILSGNFKPNTGVFKGEVPWQDIINKFKGTELHDYLERLSQKKIKAAYKPQKIDLIPNMWKGSVKQLLEKIDNKKKLAGILKRLNAENIINKNIDKLSGGELQLLSIIATISKDADFYFFDEPSSYLDAYERLLVAKEIRSLSEKAFVMVVEHDLAVADYLADYTHILYGNPGVFGVVSNPYGVRVGINTYLEGYIREENMRFRKEPIVFAKRAKSMDKNKIFLEYPAFEKKFTGFSLETRKGNLYSGEIIGIVGPNGIGKTTFIKMLAGELKPDIGEAPKKLKISYKPQRIILSKEEKTMSVLEFVRHEEVKLSQENKKILFDLGVEKLMERNINSLSGGELQSVFVACALSRDADLLLLDEPSAFLDVEQRLNVAKILRSYAENKEISCFIVDHDLQFIDAVSDRLMVFEGNRGVKGTGNEPCKLASGMNQLLKDLGITYRRDPVTGRPRANKPDSQKDTEQKRNGQYFYVG
ncbi:MAG: ribosome biogenesis/translation initiation ATPase RLI [Nanoarchaeota archaeon]